MIPNGDTWAVQFLLHEPVDHAERGWLAAYAVVLSRCKVRLAHARRTEQQQAVSVARPARNLRHKPID
jgi:hypothetical protein